MSATLDELYAAALALPENTRMELVERLLGSMSVEQGLEREHLAEVHRRIQEVESGAVPRISAEEVFRQIRGSLAARAVAPDRISPARVPG